jgi:hypothetical protein
MLDGLTDDCEKIGCDGKYEYSIDGGGVCDKCGDRQPCL